MALSEGELDPLPACSPTPLAEREGGTKTNEVECGDADQQPTHSPAVAHHIQREQVRESNGETERSEEANEPALVQSQHHRHKSWFCTISSRLS